MMLSNEETTHLADILRIEMQEYGALLNILMNQQDAIMSDDVDSLLVLNASIERQAAKTKNLQNRRKAISGDFAAKSGIASFKKMKQLLVAIPEEQKSMFVAIIDEINSLIDRSKAKMRQNRMLLIRVYNFTEKLLSELQPTERVKTYDRSGYSTINNSIKGKAVTLTA